MKKLLILTALITLSGCSLFQQQPVTPEVTVLTEQVPMKIFQPPAPAAVDLRDISWFVITEENLEQKIEQIRKLQDTDNIVVFAITPSDYENMTFNMQELRRYIRQQKEIILYYQEATQPEESEVE